VQQGRSDPQPHRCYEQSPLFLSAGLGTMKKRDSDWSLVGSAWVSAQHGRPKIRHCAEDVKPDARRHCAEICIASEEVQEGTAEMVLYLEHGTGLIRLEFGESRWPASGA